MNIGVVILHYLTEVDTFQCVESFRKRIDTGDYKIVIVDNNSCNGSVEKIEEKYKNAKDVIIIKNTENLGFARGLNVGIRYAREVLDTEFILAVNNDTELVSSNLYDVLQKKYEEYHFSLLGPMIICGDGVCTVNPITDKLRDDVEVQASINRYKKLLMLNRLHLLKLYLRLANIKRSFSKRKSKPVQLLDKKNVKLHGCFWILSKEYFSKFKQLDESTFLYMEEDIIYLHLIKNGLTSLFSPEIIVYHKEYSSTSEKFKNTREKQNFIYRNCIESQEYYLKLWNRYNG